MKDSNMREPLSKMIHACICPKTMRQNYSLYTSSLPGLIWTESSDYDSMQKDHVASAEPHRCPVRGHKRGRTAVYVAHLVATTWH